MAHIFDVIQSDRSWTDEVLLNMTLSRLLQVYATIMRRKYVEEKKREDLVAWQTRTVCKFLSGTAFDGKVAEYLSEQADKIGLTEAEMNEEPKAKSSKEPEDGSYERFMMSFGRALPG